MTRSQVTDVSGGRLRIARSRGALGGALLVLLGIWGGIVPFVGPYFDFAYTPDSSWTWTAARGWLEVLPGAVVFVGGLLLLATAHRGAALVGAWFGILGGAWFIIGPELADLLNIGSPGTPTASSTGMRALEALAYFFALGAVIMFLAAAAFGRLSVRSLGDVRAAQLRDTRLPAAEPVPAAPAGAHAAGGEYAAPAATPPVAGPAAQPAAPHRMPHFGRRRRVAEPADSEEAMRR